MNSTLLLLKGKISDVNLIELKGRLDRMASVGHYSLDLSPVLSTLKSPGIGLVLGFLFGWLGVDRFYKGDVWLGIADLFLVYTGIKKDNFKKIMASL